MKSTKLVKLLCHFLVIIQNNLLFRKLIGAGAEIF
jgi:hypothetical protein